MPESFTSLTCSLKKTQRDQALKAAQINFTSPFCLLAGSVLLVISTTLCVCVCVYIYIYIYTDFLFNLKNSETSKKDYLHSYRISFSLLNTA